MEGYQTEAAQLRHKLTQLDRLYNGFLLNRPRSTPAALPTPSPSTSSKADASKPAVRKGIAASKGGGAKITKSVPGRKKSV